MSDAVDRGKGIFLKALRMMDHTHTHRLSVLSHESQAEYTDIKTTTRGAKKKKAIK